MRRKENGWDNAPTENGFNSGKTERVHGIRDATYNDMKAESCESLEGFYNRKRQHSTLGHRSPAQFLDASISKQHQEKPGA
jgi:transposase InsO family protein